MSDTKPSPFMPWKPCPWCQGPPGLEEDGFMKWLWGSSWRLKCQACGSVRGIDAGWRDSLDDAVLAWNHRVEPKKENL